MGKTLFERITTCADAIRCLRDNDEKLVLSCEEVMRHLPRDKATEHKNTNLIKASLQYLKLGFVDADTPIRKVNVAMWVAVSAAYDHHNTRLAEEIGARFQRLDDFDRNVMEKIFSFSIYNERVGKLLDKAMVEKKRGIHLVIEHELNVEFVLLFFGIMDSLVRRGHSLVDLGYAANATSSDMERAREIIDIHLDDIASKCSPCFKKHVLKQRGRNSLFPALNAFPEVSIGSRHIDFDEATFDTLKESLLDKDEKGEFLEMMFAMISHASNEPIVTFRCLRLESVKAFFLEKVLDEVQAKEAIEVNVFSDEARGLRREVVSLKEEILSLKEKEDIIGVKFDLMAKENPTLRRKNEELMDELTRVKRALALSEKAVEDLREYYGNNGGEKKQRIMSSKERVDKMWLMTNVNHDEDTSEENVCSGDEEE